MSEVDCQLELTMRYFLDLYGETSPQVDLDYADVLAARGKSSAGPIYEYFWTLGRYEPPQQEEEEEEEEDNLGRDLSATANRRKRLRFPWVGKAESGEWGKFSARSFAQVYVLFPRNSGWRVHEVAASVKYLAPIPEQESFLQKMDKDIAALQPLLGVAGTAVGAVGAVGAGPVASATGHVLDAMAKMKLGSVPQAPGFEWSVKKVTTWVGKEHSDAESPRETDTVEIVDGVVWNLPPSMFEALGSRINGSIAVSLLPAPSCEPRGAESPALQAGIVRACAWLPLEPTAQWVPSQGHVRLEVHPR